MAESALTREGVAAAMREFAAGQKRRRIRMFQFYAVAGVSEEEVRRLFPHGACEVLAAAGVWDRCTDCTRVSPGALMRELERVRRAVGHVPRREDVERHGSPRARAYEEHLGEWGRVMEVYARWRADREKPKGPVRLPARVVGEPLGFGGLSHAPVNEMGVVHLFGLLGPRLPIVVEHIGAAYPDCVAVRREGDRWTRIAIEFEHRSSNFMAHGHDPALCDLIVCWEHDWAECPVEVLELRGELERARRGEWREAA